MSEKIKKSGKFNGNYVDYCEEFDPSNATIKDTKSNDREWTSFEVPSNEPEHVARPDRETDLSKVLARAKALKIGQGILSAARLS